MIIRHPAAFAGALTLLAATGLAVLPRASAAEVPRPPVPIIAPASYDPAPALAIP